MIQGKIKSDEDKRAAFSDFLREQGVLDEGEYVTPVRCESYETKKGPRMILHFRIEQPDA